MRRPWTERGEEEFREGEGEGEVEECCFEWSQTTKPNSHPHQQQLPSGRQRVNTQFGCRWRELNGLIPPMRKLPNFNTTQETNSNGDEGEGGGAEARKQPATATSTSRG
ncbi:hypothetical protein NL676_000918 [Syzygium grande]|nr:hypothetical protein NL676_000918 [Syzygium grande]